MSYIALSIVERFIEVDKSVWKIVDDNNNAGTKKLIVNLKSPKLHSWLYLRACC